MCLRYYCLENDSRLAVSRGRLRNTIGNDGNVEKLDCVTGKTPISECVGYLLNYKNASIVFLFSLARPSVSLDSGCDDDCVRWTSVFHHSARDDREYFGRFHPPSDFGMTFPRHRPPALTSKSRKKNHPSHCYCGCCCCCGCCCYCRDD